MPSYLEFISDEDLVVCVMKVVKALEKAEKEADNKFFFNAIDPFSAIFDAHCHGLNLDDWMKSEKARQIQKTMQNALGVFHQDILGSMLGWENLEVGHVVDIRNKKKKIIAEVKNKFNTTKGNHKVNVYDDLKGELSKPEHKNFIGYYVEIISDKKSQYDKPFTPSDNTIKDKKSKKRPIDERIRVIDGVTFYDKASGHTGTLKKLYLALPNVIADQTGKPASIITDDPLFIALYNQTFK